MTEIGGTCNPWMLKKSVPAAFRCRDMSLESSAIRIRCFPRRDRADHCARAKHDAGILEQPGGNCCNIPERLGPYRDVGYLDSEGYLFFVGRTKDIIRRSGENIAAVEVENAVMEHPKIAEAAAVPVPDLSGMKR